MRAVEDNAGAATPIDVDLNRIAQSVSETYRFGAARAHLDETDSDTEPRMRTLCCNEHPFYGSLAASGRITAVAELWNVAS